MAEADFLKAARSTPVITLSDTEARVEGAQELHP